MKQTGHLRFWISTEEPKDKYQPKQVFWNVSGMKTTNTIKRVVSHEEIAETINRLISIYDPKTVEFDINKELKKLGKHRIKIGGE